VTHLIIPYAAFDGWTDYSVATIGEGRAVNNVKNVTNNVA